MLATRAATSRLLLICTVFFIVLNHFLYRFAIQILPDFLTFPNIFDRIFKIMADFFKTNLIYLREKREETQQETALALNLSRSTYSNYEAGENYPKADILPKILGHYGVTFEEIMYIDLTKTNIYKDENSKFLYSKTVQDKKSSEIPENRDISNLIESNRMLSKANMDLAENAVALTRLLSSGVGQGSALDAAARQTDLLESLAEGLSRDGYFQSSQEAALELNRLSSEFESQILLKGKKVS